MTGVPSAVDDFYERRVPAQWNRTLDAQIALADDDASAQPMLDGMRSVNTSIEVEVHAGAAGTRRYLLDIADGRMSCGDAPSRPPFLVLAHDLDTFATLERESGDSVLGFLGTLAGQPGDMKLTSTRLQNLLALQGRARLELTGGSPMTLDARFGPDPDDDEREVAVPPDCTLRVTSEAFAALRVGELAPQDAFMSGQVEIDGDMQLAMQLALAALSPD